MGKEPLSLAEHQAVLLRLLKEFDDYCNRHGLRYFLFAGTLLGAVRHHGFIPWDDDVDVLMPREDYETFIRADFIAEDAQVISLHNSQGHYHPFPYCNIADTKTVMTEKIIKHPTGKGVFIDVFPLDGVPDDPKEQARHLRRLIIRQSVFAAAINIADGSGIKRAAKSLIGLAAAPFDQAKMGDRISKTAQKHRYDDCSKVGCTVHLRGQPEKFIYRKDCFSDYILLDFEDCKVRCPVGYQEVLTTCYGDYMQLPPEDQRIAHHEIEIYRL